DDVCAVAAEAAHCFAETARWTAALVGLAVEVDADDIPYLRAAGDLASARLQFDVYEPAHYLALEETTAAEETPAEPAAPDLVVNVTAAPLRASGDGTVIAVIDSGFDADAAWLTLPEGVSPALTGDALAARLALTGRTVPDEGQDAAKVPFLCNYTAPGESVAALASHGTRVAALAGANHGDEYDGTAPGAQLLLMKVFGESLEAGADEDVILSAIDDALLLGADVINLSLGFPAGDSGEGAGLAEAVAAAQGVGVGIVAAAGNSGETGAGSFFYARTNSETYPTDHPDRGTIAAPASLPGVIAVGAATGSYGKTTVLLDEAGNRISYSDTCAEYIVQHEIGGRSFADLLGGAPFSYVAVPGVGAAADYAELNVVGRVALVERGEISFVEKTRHAADAGAIGVIVYDNDPETDGAVNMQLDDAVLPAIFINIEDGQRLAETSSGTLSFPDRDPSTRGMRVKGVADFSSRGLRDDFTFAPSLVALGDSFVGLSADDSIAVLEGSSYAAPQVAGALAALMSELRDDGTPEANVLATAKTLLQNTAAPLTDPDTGNTPTSVRAQGAGVLDLAAAPDAPLMLTGSDAGTITTAGAGETFTLTFTAKNRTAADLDVTLTPTIFADAYRDPLAEEDPDTLTEAAEAYLALCAYDRANAYFCVDGSLTSIDAEITLDGTPIRATGAHITLAPGETREITLTVTLAPDTYAAYTTAFPNGFTVEGRVKAETSTASLTLPWAVFCGDWSAAPLISPTAYDADAQLYIGQTITARLISGYEIALGEMQGGDPVQNGVQYMAELAAINPHGLAEPLTLDACLLRNVARYIVAVTNAAGETVYTAEGGGLRKAYRYNSAAVAERIPLWDGSVTDNPKFICPDGIYTITLTLYGESGGEQTLTLPVRIDTTVPVLESAAFRRTDGALMLDLTFSDAEYVRDLYLADRRGMVEYDYSFFETTKILPAGRGASLTLSVNATGLYQKYIYLTLTDYAYNTVTLRLDRELLFTQSGVN
ncbi:MAG: S8 family serine peptidase, partial [Clostridia bacterium]|nr:S8 family serine peptidase [Clostridia bacterium]